MSLRRGQHDGIGAAAVGDRGCAVAMAAVPTWVAGASAPGEAGQSNHRRVWPPSRHRPAVILLSRALRMRCTTGRDRVPCWQRRRPGAEVRWGVAGRMVVAWLSDAPLAGLVRAFTYRLVHFIGGYPGAILRFPHCWLTATAILAAVARGRRSTTPTSAPTGKAT